MVKKRLYHGLTSIPELVKTNKEIYGICKAYELIVDADLVTDLNSFGVDWENWVHFSGGTRPPRLRPNGKSLFPTPSSTSHAAHRVGRLQPRHIKLRKKTL